jgi:hypothetical protein
MSNERSVVSSEQDVQECDATEVEKRKQKVD